LTGTEVIFPISTRFAVAGAFELKPGSVIELGETNVARINGAQVAYSQRQVYSRDWNFKYALQPNEQPHKASKLNDDQRFRKPAKQEDDAAQD
jgi:hypothetical protein